MVGAGGKSFGFLWSSKLSLLASSVLLVLYGLAFKRWSEAFTAKVSESEVSLEKRVETTHLHLVCAREAGKCIF